MQFMLRFLRIMRDYDLMLAATTYAQYYVCLPTSLPTYNGGYDTMKMTMSAITTLNIGDPFPEYMLINPNLSGQTANWVEAACAVTLAARKYTRTDTQTDGDTHTIFLKVVIRY